MLIYKWARPTCCVILNDWNFSLTRMVLILLCSMMIVDPYFKVYAAFANMFYDPDQDAKPAVDLIGRLLQMTFDAVVVRMNYYK